MARSLKNKPNVLAPSAQYPNGRIKDNPGDGSGTPVNEQVYGDFHQFFARLLVEAGITPNEISENAYDGFQYIQALKSLSAPDGIIQRTKTIPIGAWNMVSTPNIVIAHGLSFSKIRGFEAVILDDLSTLIFQISINGSISSGSISITNSSILLGRAGGGTFDNTGYDDSVMNRGYVTIRYVE